MTPELVGMAGLRHSGSTLLSLMLGNHPQVLALGETQHVYRALREGFGDFSRPCSCGSLPENCPIWGDVLETFSTHRNVTRGQYHRILGDRLADEYPEVRVYVDSSKHRPYLESLRTVGPDDLSFLHLVRDVRGWVTSKLNNPTPSATPGRPLEFYLPERLRRTVPYLAWRWQRENHRFEQFLRDQVPSNHVRTVSYENLCLRTAETMKSLSTFLDLDFHPSLLTPASESNHVLFGNSMRLDPARRSTISYDDRWMRSSRIQFWGWLLALLSEANNRWVYAEP